MTLHIADNSTIQKSARGVSQTRFTERGITFSRLPAWTYSQHAHAPVVATMAERLSGAHLRLKTAASKISVRYRALRDMNVSDGWVAGPSSISITSDDYEKTISHTNGDLRIWDGMAIREIQEGEDSVAEFQLPNPHIARELQIWLPQNCPIELIEIAADAPLAASEESLPKWIHYGSSISHCEDADGPLGVWPVVASRQLGLEIYNLGMGGCANLEQFSARTIRDLPADVISLKLGINVVNGTTLTERTFGPAVHGFIDTIRDKHPSTPVLVISPVCCPAHENHPGPSEAIDGQVQGQPFSRHGWIGELTLVGIRKILSELVASRAQSDSNIFYLDGLGLFNESDAPTMPDGIHPDASGYRRIGANFLKHYPRKWLAGLKADG
jgi:hypothetical protein